MYLKNLGGLIRVQLSSWNFHAGHFGLNEVAGCSQGAHRSLIGSVENHFLS